MKLQVFCWAWNMAWIQVFLENSINCTLIKDPFLGGILLKDSFIFWVTFPIPGFLSGAPCKEIFLKNTSFKEKGNCAPVFVCRKNQSQSTVFLWGERLVLAPQQQFWQTQICFIKLFKLFTRHDYVSWLQKRFRSLFCSVEKSPYVTVYFIFDHSRFERVSDPWY